MGKLNKAGFVKKFGRSGDTKYFPVYLSILESDAYKSLRPIEKCLLEEFRIVNFKTRANGRLNLSVEVAAKRLGIAKNTVMPAFHVLEERGFIRCTVGEVYQERLARLWRITFLPWNGREPTDEWRNWGRSDAGGADECSENSETRSKN